MCFILYTNDKKKIRDKTRKIGTKTAKNKKKQEKNKKQEIKQTRNKSISFYHKLNGYYQKVMLKSEISQEDINMTILKTKNLRKTYGTGDTQVHALDGVDFKVEEGEFVSIVGTSGSGKSTLLHMLGGLDRPSSGQVYVGGKDIFSLKEEELTIFRRRKIGFVFQSYNLVPVLNVYENIVLPIDLDGGKPEKEYVEEIIKTLGLESKQNNLPNQLSGGQQQRVAIARALATKPAIILADEPTGNLDSKTSQDVLSLLKISSEKFSQTIVMITHNEEIAQLADRIIQIEDGKIIKRGE